ncbi:MAG: hypothetical protein AAB524_01370 [Patescibacteria group bacterium]
MARIIANALESTLVSSLLASFLLPWLAATLALLHKSALFGWIYLGIAVSCTVLAGFAFAMWVAIEKDSDGTPTPVEDIGILVLISALLISHALP